MTCVLPLLSHGTGPPGVLLLRSRITARADLAGPSLPQRELSLLCTCNTTLCQSCQLNRSSLATPTMVSAMVAIFQPPSTTLNPMAALTLTQTTLTLPCGTGVTTKQGEWDERCKTRTEELLAPADTIKSPKRSCKKPHPELCLSHMISFSFTHRCALAQISSSLKFTQQSRALHAGLTLQHWHSWHRR